MFVHTKGFCTDVFFQAALGWIQEGYDLSLMSLIDAIENFNSMNPKTQI